MTGQRHRSRLTLALLCLLLALASASCTREDKTQSPASTGNSSSTAPATPSAELLWTEALAWIRSAPTQATADDARITLTYGDQASILHIVPSADVSEPMLPVSWRAGDEDFYWQTDNLSGQEDLQQGQAIPTMVLHVTPAAAVASDNATDLYDPEGSFGLQIIGLVRLLGDPYRLLSICEPGGEPQKLANSNWLLRAEKPVIDVVGTDLEAARHYERVLGPTADAKVKVTLEVTPEGAPVATTTTWGTNAPIEYAWSRAAAAPELPVASMELGAWTRQHAERSGYRTVAEAAKESEFPLYWLAESYQGIPLWLVRADAGAVTLHYHLFPAGAAVSSTTTVPQPGYILFEYAASNVPESEKPFVANKTLYKTLGEGDEAYSVYKTAKGAPGQSILVRRGDTYISVEGSGPSGKVFDELLAVAAAFQRVER